MELRPMRWILAVTVALCTGSARAQYATPLFTPILDEPITSFSLKDQNGATFTPEQLRGKVWLAHFFFTTCTQGCDKTIARMKDIQEAIRGKSDLALVSISVNPELDDVNRLKEFSAALNAEPGQW